MRKLTITFLTIVFCLNSNVVMSKTMDELVEVYLINQIDDHRGYCLDIKGYKSRANINRGMHAHTCYSYQGDIAVDQGFDRRKIMKNQFLELILWRIIQPKGTASC